MFHKGMFVLRLGHRLVREHFIACTKLNLLLFPPCHRRAVCCLCFGSTVCVLVKKICTRILNLSVNACYRLELQCVLEIYKRFSFIFSVGHSVTNLLTLFTALFTAPHFCLYFSISRKSEYKMFFRSRI